MLPQALCLLEDRSQVASARRAAVELAESLGVSRGPLREAVRQLVGEGLLVVVNHKGAYVKEFSPEELRNLYDLRSALEVHAIRKLRPDSDFTGLEANVARSLELNEQGTPNYSVDTEFHATIAALSGNQALERSVGDVQRQIALNGSMLGYFGARAQDAAREHKEILDALKSGQVDQAAELLTLHLDRALQKALAVMEAR